jgi:Tol biopolymer transport system component
MAAAWSPDGSRVAIGGVGQCPYGALVMDSSLNVITAANPPPSMCEPAWSPDGQYIAFTGINPRLDGRVDVYVANNNGYSIGNLTGAFRGQIRMFGWVGGR